MTIDINVETWSSGCLYDITIDDESPNRVSLQLDDADDAGNLVWYLLHTIPLLEEEKLRLAQQLSRAQHELDDLKATEAAI